MIKSVIMNQPNSSGNAVSNLADEIKKMSEDELKKKIGELAVEGEDFSEYKKELDLKKNKPQSSVSGTSEDSEKKIKSLLEKKTLKKEEKENLKKLILEEIKNHKQSSEDIQKQKNLMIAGLEHDLMTERTANNQILTDTPSLTEYFSIQRKRGANMLKKFNKFKGLDRNNYPKNLLIYAMGITDNKLFGARQMLKRGWVTLAWKWKEDDIVNNLKTMLDKTKPNSNDSKWKAAIKEALYKEIQVALEMHNKKLIAELEEQKNKLIKKNSLPNYR